MSTGILYFVPSAQHEPCVVQFMPPPYIGLETLNAGPAQFGQDLKRSGEVSDNGRIVDLVPKYIVYLSFNRSTNSHAHNTK